jgi:hypothetical protein
MSQVVKDNIVYEDGEPLFEFKGYEEVEIDEEFERKINSFFCGAPAECMDDKTKIKKKEIKPIDYGPMKDADGNIIESLPEQPPLPTPKPFVRNSIFH